ncbi:hypothetical protein V1289_002249 [Bradyrhizobium sp. AZCC 2289]
MERREPTATLTFYAGNALLASCVMRGHEVNQGSFPMPLVSKLSIVTAYIAFAFVGAIVLGVF